MEPVALLLLLTLSLMLGACAAPRRVPQAEDPALRRYAERAYLPEVHYVIEHFNVRWPSDDPAASGEMQVSLTLPNRQGSYPLIVYLPGLGESADAGMQWRTAWAEAGYAVLAFQASRFGPIALPGRYAMEADYTAQARQNYATAALNERLHLVGSVLFELKKRVDRREAPYNRIDTSRMLFAGYDLGAQAVQALIGEKVPGVVLPSLPYAPLAAIVISPYTSVVGGAFAHHFGEIKLPVLMATASDDIDRLGVVSRQTARAAPFTYMPAGNKYLLLLAGGSHHELSGDEKPGGEPGDADGPRQGSFGDRPKGGPGGGGPGRGVPPGGGMGGTDGPMGGGHGSPGGGMPAPGYAGMGQQVSADNPRHTIAVQRVSVAFLDATVHRDAIASEWLERDAERWLGQLGELRRK